MKECISREAALAALKEYNKEPFHILHALTVEGVMRWYANELGCGEDADFWATVGLLHDIDFEMWPEQHCVKVPELLKKAGCSDEFIHAVCFFQKMFFHCFIRTLSCIRCLAVIRSFRVCSQLFIASLSNVISVIFIYCCFGLAFSLVLFMVYN